MALYWCRVLVPRAERRRHSRRTQMFLESIFRTPLTLPGASMAPIWMRKSLAQAAKASSSPATPMIAITRFML